MKSKTSLCYVGFGAIACCVLVTPVSGTLQPPFCQDLDAPPTGLYLTGDLGPQTNFAGQNFTRALTIGNTGCYPFQCAQLLGTTPSGIGPSAFTSTNGATDFDTNSFLAQATAGLPMTMSLTMTSSIPGIYLTPVTVSNGVDLHVSVVLTNYVLNSSPVVQNPIPDQTNTYGSPFNYAFPTNTFSDPDPGQALSYTATNLPPGITFDGPTRTFSGTNSSPGTFAVTVTATDNGLPPLSTNDVFSFVVLDCSVLGIMNASLPIAVKGTPYIVTLVATNGTAPYTFAVTSGTLPGNLTLAPGGLLSGTPTNTGSFPVSITVASAVGCVAISNYVLNVVCPAIAGAPLWTNYYHGAFSFDDNPTGMAVDADGNVYVTGYSAISASPTYGFVTVAYSSAGVPKWTNVYASSIGGQSSLAVAVVANSDTNIVVTGSSENHFVTVAYSAAGVPLWTNVYTGLSGSGGQPVAMAADKNGRVFVGGNSFPPGNSGDFATIALSGAGALLWSKGYNGPSNGVDAVAAIKVDGSGNVFVTGASSGANDNNDFATIKYSNAGVPLWTNRYDGSAHGGDGPEALAVDNGGNVFVTGYSAQSNSYPDNIDFLTIKYSGAGVSLWTNRYNGQANGDDRAFGIALDAETNVVVSGQESSTNGYYEYGAILKYSAAGVPLWTNRTYGYFGFPMAIDAAGNIFAAASGIPSKVVAYSKTGAPLWTNILGDGNIRAVTVDGLGNVLVAGEFWVDTGYRYGTFKYSAQCLEALVVPSAIVLENETQLPSGVFQFTFTNVNGATFTTLATTNPALPLSNWTELGPPTEVSPGQFQFIDPQAPTNRQRFYRVRSP